MKKISTESHNLNLSTKIFNKNCEKRVMRIHDHNKIFKKKKKRKIKSIKMR